MNEAKLATARIDTERVLRELLTAFDSLKPIATPGTCSLSGEEEPQERPPQSEEGHSEGFQVVGRALSTQSADQRPPLEAVTAASDIDEAETEHISTPGTCSPPGEEEREQRPPQSEEGRSKAIKVVGSALPIISADQRPKPRTSLQALTAGSDIDESETEQVSTFASAENSKLRDDQMKPQLSQQEIIEEFLGDHELLDRLQVTPQEIQSLSTSSLLGSLTCRQDMLFILRLLREGPNSAEHHATVTPESRHATDENIEPPTPDPGEMAERIRLGALANLNESDSLKGIVRHSALRRYGVFSAAFVLIQSLLGTGSR
jgi:hypothetical protein